MNGIEISSDVIWEKISNEGVPSLSKEELVVLSENREEFINKAVSEISFEIKRLQKKLSSLNPTCLYWSLRLIAFFRSPLAFELIKKLCRFSAEQINKAVGLKRFVFFELRYLIALSIADDWKKAEKEFGKKFLDEEVRISYINSLAILYLRKEIDRVELVEYVKGIFKKAISGELKDSLLISELIFSCSIIWPGECIEEIKELFGLGFEASINIYQVLSFFDIGLENCLDLLQKKLGANLSLNISERFHYDVYKSTTDKSIDEKIKKAIENPRSIDLKPDKNDPCSCRSGLKYRICCGKGRLWPFSIMAERTSISYDALDLDKMTDLQIECAHKTYCHLKKEPKKTYVLAKNFVARFPDASVFYNHLYEACMILGYNHEALSMLKTIVRRFPDYLFGKLAFCMYLLRRGEPYKVKQIFPKNTLKRSCPDRSIFHISEYCLFNCVKGWYFADIGQISIAKTYLEMICEAIDAEEYSGYASDSIYFLMKKIALQVSLRLAEKKESLWMLLR